MQSGVAAVQYLLQLAGLVHLHHDVRAADKLAAHIQLRNGWPVAVVLDALADAVVLKYVHRLERLGIDPDRPSGSGWHGPRSRTWGKLALALHEKNESRFVLTKSSMRCWASLMWAPRKWARKIISPCAKARRSSVRCRQGPCGFVLRTKPRAASSCSHVGRLIVAVLQQQPAACRPGGPARFCTIWRMSSNPSGTGDQRRHGFVAPRPASADPSAANVGRVAHDHRAIAGACNRPASWPCAKPHRQPQPFRALACGQRPAHPALASTASNLQVSGAPFARPAQSRRCRCPGQSRAASHGKPLQSMHSMAQSTRVSVSGRGTSTRASTCSVRPWNSFSPIR
jgi:hypothetical protein